MKVAAYPLHSGFATVDTGKLVRLKQAERSVKDRIHEANVAKPDLENCFDTVVENLMDMFRKNEAVIRDMSFREDLIKSVYRCLGTIDLNLWIKMQTQCPTVGSLHARFLVETLDYVFNCTPRPMELFTYYRLLNGSPESKNWAGGNDGQYEKLVAFLKTTGNCNISDIVTLWTRDTASITDMLVTLHVIFGRRHGNLNYAIRQGRL